MAEVLLVIWTQWSRKPSDREISVSVRERANGKRQQENEKRAAVPGLRLEMEPGERIGRPAVRLLFFPVSLRNWWGFIFATPIFMHGVGVFPSERFKWFHPTGHLSRSNFELVS